MRTRIGSFAGAVALVAAACGATGLGSAVREDIGARMATTRDPLAACYKERLAKNRRLRGTVVVAVTAEAKTGQFKNVQIRRDDPGDPGLNDCIVAEVGKLKLEKPTSTQVSFEYPIEFMPTDLAK
jgi:hypothetical protein